MIKVAINGFGRIGRPVFKRILSQYSDKIEVVAINDLTKPATLAHLLKYDSLYGVYEKDVKATDEAIKINGQEIKILSVKDPAELPWKDLEVDVVLECTGLFRKKEDAERHLQAGAKKVILSAPSKSKDVSHFILGVNEEDYDLEKDNIVSMCSCTTNCLAPVAKIMHEELEIESGLMTTIHSYTNNQNLLDLPHKDLRRARAAGLSMIPTTTGAAIAVIKTLPELEGKIHGLAIRVPTPVVSLVDFTAKVVKDTSIEEVNHIFKKASDQPELKGILGIEDAPLVSIDYRGNSFSSIVDAGSTMVQKGNLVKVLSWYDNEWGYACRLADFCKYIGKKL